MVLQVLLFPGEMFPDLERGLPVPVEHYFFQGVQIFRILITDRYTQIKPDYFRERINPTVGIRSLPASTNKSPQPWFPRVAPWESGECRTEFHRTIPPGGCDQGPSSGYGVHCGGLPVNRGHKPVLQVKEKCAAYRC